MSDSFDKQRKAALVRVHTLALIKLDNEYRKLLAFRGQETLNKGADLLVLYFERKVAAGQSLEFAIIERGLRMQKRRNLDEFFYMAHLMLFLRR